MDNYCCRNYIVRRTIKYGDGSYQQCHIYESDSKQDALNYIERSRKTAKNNEKYELINNNMYGV